jgi:hypothetical protein
MFIFHRDVHFLKLIAVVGLMSIAGCGDDAPAGGAGACLEGALCPCFPGDTVCPGSEICRSLGGEFVCQADGDASAPDAGPVDSGFDVSTDVDAGMDAGPFDADTADADPDDGDAVVADAVDAVTTDIGPDAADVVQDSANDVTDTTPSDAGTDAESTPQLSAALRNPWIVAETNAFADLDVVPPRGTQLALLRPSSDNVYHLATGDREMFAPTISPDGVRVAFVARNGSARQIKVLNLVTNVATVLLASPPAGTDNLEWDATGAWLAFDAIAEPGAGAADTRDIFVVRVADSAVTRVTDDEANERGPRWTIDGELWYLSTRDGDGAGSVFRSVRSGADWSESRVSDDLSLLGRFALDPSGEFLVSVQAITGGDGARLVRYDVDADRVTNLSGADANGPVIARDGLVSVFTSSRFGGSDLLWAGAFDGIVTDRLTPATPFVFEDAVVSPVESTAVSVSTDILNGGT